jgi:hypothetical protein
MGAREIVNDAPCLAIILRSVCSRPHLAHESNVRRESSYVLATRWSFASRGQSEAGRRIPGYSRKPPCYAKRMGRKPRGRSAQFNGVAEGEQVLVPLDKDVADWLRKQGDLVREVNGLCRFYMDTCITRVLEFDLAEFEAAQSPKHIDGPRR